MANRKSKICSFTPYPKEKEKVDPEKEKIRLDIEILRSIRYKFREDKEIKSHFDGVISKLIKML